MKKSLILIALGLFSAALRLRPMKSRLQVPAGTPTEITATQMRFMRAAEPFCRLKNCFRARR